MFVFQMKLDLRTSNLEPLFTFDQIFNHFFFVFFKKKYNTDSLFN